MNKLSLLLVVPAVLTGAYAVAQTASHDSASNMSRSSATVAPDNTKSNKTAPSNRGVTADNQTNASGDIELTKRIRQSVMAGGPLVDLCPQREDRGRWWDGNPERCRDQCR